MGIITGGNIIAGGNVNGDGTGAQLTWIGAPTNGASGTYVGKVAAGTVLRRIDNGTLYQATLATTTSSVTWALVTTPA